jgi:hypothetical protein
VHRAKTAYGGRWTPGACSAPRVGLSEVYNGVLSDVLTQALGWGWKSSGGFTSGPEVRSCQASQEELQKAFLDPVVSHRDRNERDALPPDFVAPDGRIVCTNDIAIVTFSATLAVAMLRH